MSDVDVSNLNLRNVVLVRVGGDIYGGIRTMAGYHDKPGDRFAPYTQNLLQYCPSEESKTALRNMLNLAQWTQSTQQLTCPTTSGISVLYLAYWIAPLTHWKVATFDLPYETDLTKRQLDVLTGLAADKTYAEIAREMRVAKSSVESHVSRMREKFAVETTPGLIAAAFQAGVL